MSEVVQVIKEKLDIVDVLSGYIQLKPAGKNFKALCPFHAERTPSFVVSRERGTWHCFGACQTGGDIFTFLMKWENITFTEALKELAEKAGVELKTDEFADHEYKRKTSLLKVYELAAKYYEYILHNTKYGEQAKEYLVKRGLREATMHTFRLGYALNTWDGLLTFLKKRGVSQEALVESGLFIQKDSGGLYDRFRGRIMFPIADHRGNIIAFSGRILTGEGEAKYINSPETFTYKKRASLYNIHLAKEAIKKAGSVILVEGEMDVITPYQHGVSHVVAIKGTALTPEHLQELKKYTKKLIFALDADTAGFEALKRSIFLAEKDDFEMYVIPLNQLGVKDMDEAFAKKSAETMALIKKPLVIYDVIMQQAKTKYGTSDVMAKKQYAEAVAPFLALIQNPIVRGHYTHMLAKEIEGEEADVKQLIKKEEKKRLIPSFRPPVTAKREGEKRSVLLQKYVLGMFLQGEFKKWDLFDPEDFLIPSYKKLAHACVSFTKDRPYEAQEFAGRLPSELRAVFDELYLYATNAHQDKELPEEKSIYNLKQLTLKERMAALINEETVDSSAIELSRQLKEVEKKLLTL